MEKRFHSLMKYIEPMIILTGNRTAKIIFMFIISLFLSERKTPREVLFPRG
jgi:hypothetical protein